MYIYYYTNLLFIFAYSWFKKIAIIKRYLVQDVKILLKLANNAKNMFIVGVFS